MTDKTDLLIKIALMLAFIAWAVALGCIGFAVMVVSKLIQYMTIIKEAFL